MFYAGEYSCVLLAEPIAKKIVGLKKRVVQLFPS
jgi:hypothetical protein